MAKTVQLKDENGDILFPQTSWGALDGDPTVAVARFSKTDLDSTLAASFSDASWQYRRTYNKVEFFGRFSLANASEGFVALQQVPTGYRVSHEFDDTVWNVPLNAVKFSALGTFIAGGFVERQATNKVQIACTTTGNVYFYGSWPTDDPFPVG